MNVTVKHLGCMKRLAVPACLTIASATTLPVPAYALPDGFPNLSQFTETAAAQIKRNTQATINSFAAFKTPDGLEC